jgi:hypothetical protein
VFENGTPEEYCKWRIDYDDLVTYPSFKNKAEAKFGLLLSILKGKSRDSFATYHAKLKSENEKSKEKDRVDDETVLKLALNALASDVFMVNPVRRQQHYMRNGLLINGNLTVREWGNRLMELNKYFPYFPVDETRGRRLVPYQGFPEDELNDILDRAKPMSWHTIMLELNLDVQDMSWDKILDYYEKLEMSDRLMKLRTRNDDKSNGDGGNKRKRGRHGRARNQSNDDNGNKTAPQNGTNGKTRKTACKHCSKWHAVPDSQCWSLEQNKAKRPRLTSKGSENAAKPKAEASYVTQKQVSNMLAALPAFKNAKRLKKRKVIVDSDSDTEANFKSFHTS